MTGDAAPLIVTATFDAASFEHFNSMRRRHFPLARNHIPAHLTLFHKLPGEQERQIALLLAAFLRSHSEMTVEVEGLRFLGYGTAYRLRSAALDELRERLAREWADWLTPQDRQGFRPHVTIQNKVGAPEARALFERLERDFQPFQAMIVGLSLWRYLGGPWEPAGMFHFAHEGTSPTL